MLLVRYPLDRIGPMGRANKEGRMSPIDVTYPNLLQLFPNYLSPGRSESASFLMWYLENFYRLDESEAVDAVCDNRGDKGVDGIFVNDDDMTITVFQSKISQSASRTIGDASLREFAGTLTQFKDMQSVKALINTAGDAQVATLIKRLNIEDKIGTHQLRGEFVSNIELDGNVDVSLLTNSNIIFVGKDTLVARYISQQRNIPVMGPAVFDITSVRVSEYIVDANTRAIIAPIKATELINLQGISDQSLFAYNVRGPLGRTKVNKDIVSSILEQTRHKMFPLFHNGITIVAKQLKELSDQISISQYFVVNGCQSLTALYDNRSKITDNLHILVKFIQADPSSQVAADITEYSNNQNAVKPRDFMANNPIQIRLQNEFTQNYSGAYYFEIKRGEPSQNGQAISNEDAGLLLMAFDLKEPWATHRRYQVFEEKHAQLFARPEVTADRIILLQVITDRITQNMVKVNNKLFARYSLTKYLLLYVIRFILEGDSLPGLLTNPQDFVRDACIRAKFAKLMDCLMDGLLIDLNAEIDDLGENFDYRDKLRDQQWVNELRKKLVADHLKDVKRNKLESLADQWKKL